MIHSITSVEEYNKIKESVVDSSTTAVICFTNSVSCAPCKAFKPHYTVTSEHLPEIRFYEVDIIEHMDVAVEAGVMRTPTIFFVAPGGVMKEVHARTSVSLHTELLRMLLEVESSNSE